MTERDGTLAFQCRSAGAATSLVDPATIHLDDIELRLALGPETCEPPPTHDCCQDHGKGCSDPVIEACVCAVQPSCCTIYWWDGTCTDHVLTYGCGSCAGP
jgi:hypothetical protein